MGTAFFELTSVICIASVLAIVFRFFRQPLILAYILTGILVVSSGFATKDNTELLRSMGEFGITLLLFMLGLEMKIADLSSIGKSALVVGILQVVITLVAGFAVASFFGFSTVTSIYLALAFAFSSTIIVVKVLSDKHDLNSLYGKITIGILLVQDFFAIVTLILLSGGGNIANSLGSVIGVLFLKGLAVFGGVYLLSRFVLPSILHFAARSQETLFLVSLAWALGLAAFVSSPLVGFSVEIGGLLAGLSLSSSSEQFQIASRIRSLRDFFIILFFVFLGSQMQFSNFASLLPYVVLFLWFVLLVKPIVILSIMGAIGYRKRTSFLTSIHLAQVSEFSLIVAFLGHKLGHIDNSVVSLITITGAASFVFSNYFSVHANKIFRLYTPLLSLFEKKVTQKEEREELGELEDHVVLIGADRMGKNILEVLDEKVDNLIVVDFNPDIIEKLKEKGIKTLFGDISDIDIQENLRLDKAKLIISTVSDIEDTIYLLKGLKKVKTKAKVIVLAEDHQDARDLYRHGADYVVVPHLVGGRHVVKLLKDSNLEILDEFKSKDLKYLRVT